MFSGGKQHEEGQEGHEDQPMGDKAIVTITVKFLADKEKLKKVLAGAGGDDAEEGLGGSGSGKTPPAQPR